MLDKRKRKKQLLHTTKRVEPASKLSFFCALLLAHAHIIQKHDGKIIEYASDLGERGCFDWSGWSRLGFNPGVGR